MGALGVIFTKLFGLPTWEIPLALLIIVMLAISMPSVIMASLQLHKRNLGPIRDANGWAVNAKAKMNVPFGTSLTQIATLPPRTRNATSWIRSRKRKSPRGLASTQNHHRQLVILAVIGWLLSAIWENLDKILPE